MANISTVVRGGSIVISVLGAITILAGPLGQASTLELDIPDEEGRLARWRDAVSEALESALRVQGPLVASHVESIRRRQPNATDAQLIRLLEREYLAAVSVLGAAAGGPAAAPGVGTTVTLALSVVEVGAFFELTVLFALSVARLYGVHDWSHLRQRAFVLRVVLGNSATRPVEQIAGRVGRHWGRAIVRTIPVESIRTINRVLSHNLVTKYGAKQGVLVLGRAVPFGIGAVIGAGGNAALGYGSVRAARKAFGPISDGSRSTESQ